MSNPMAIAGAAGAGPAPLPHVQRTPPQVSLLQALLDALKAWFVGRPPLTAEAIHTQLQFLRGEFLTAMGRASATLPDHRRQAFADLATTMISDVLTHCMQPVTDDETGAAARNVQESTFRQAAAKARLLVQRHLQVARGIERERLETPEVRTVWVDNPIGLHPPKVERIVLLRAAPPIENLVLRGGGAKGIGNPPALRALENLGRLSELKRVVGTSAGALTAVCLASGLSATAFQQLSDKTNMLSLLSSAGDFAQRYPEVRLGWIGFGAGNALETLDRASASAVADYLRAHWDGVLATPQWSRLHPDDQARLLRLRDQDFEASPRTGQMVTFHDLQLMHQLAPARFKELVLTGYNTDRKQNTYFSAASHPDMPVALAGRISMSIPVFFKPVSMDVEGEIQSFVDGGVGSNMPSEAILEGLHGRKMDETMARTLLMTYDEEGNAYSILHGSPAERRKASGGLMGLFTNERLDAEKIHFSGVNVMPVFHGKLGTFSFAASRSSVEQAQAQSMLNALEYIDTTMGQVRHDLVTDVGAAVRLLSLDERQAFLERHGDDMAPPHSQMCAEIRRLSQPPAAAAWL